MKRFPVLAAAAVAALFPLSAVAQTFGPAGAYFVETYTSGLSSPTTMVFVDANTALVFQKGNGQVRRVVNGVLQAAPAIDLPVNSSSERGGLGICLSPNFASDNFVFLYYSHAASDGGTWTGNRVERFLYNHGTGTLTFDQSIINFAQDPSQANGANHDGGIITGGPDGKLYIITGDLNRGRFTNPRIEQNTSTTEVAGVGGIHRLNLDGTIPSDNPFFAHASERIRTYWAYGIRNSFGMAFDPITDYIWYSENGPGNQYDELNVVPTAGMNSGWLKIAGPDARNATYSENGSTNYNANQLTILKGSYYRDPEFSWLSSIAPTAVLIGATPKLREEERDNLLMGDNNFGNLYHFPMNPARDGLVLTGGVVDKVADSAAERNLNVIGTGWGVTTDMEIGPDGYIYVVSLTGGVVRRIRPTLEHLGPNDFQVMPGIISGGNLASLQESDDVRLNMRPGIVFSTSQAPISLFVETTSPFTTIPASFELSIESHATSGSIQQSIAIEKDDGSFEVFDTRNLTTSDGTVTVTVNTNVADYFRPDGTIRARVNFRATGPVFAYPWEGRVDQALFSIQR